MTRKKRARQLPKDIFWVCLVLGLGGWMTYGYWQPRLWWGFWVVMVLASLVRVIVPGTITMPWVSKSAETHSGAPVEEDGRAKRSGEKRPYRPLGTLDP